MEDLYYEYYGIEVAEMAEMAEMATTAEMFEKGEKAEMAEGYAYGDAAVDFARYYAAYDNCNTECYFEEEITTEEPLELDCNIC